MHLQAAVADENVGEIVEQREARLVVDSSEVRLSDRQTDRVRNACSATIEL